MDTESYVVGSDSGEEEEETPDEIARRIRAQTDDIVFEDDPTDHKMGFAAIIGRPNAGKSTLMNHILGEQLSIVTAKAQTTRHKVSGIWSEPGHQVVFLDTPGIIVNQRDELEERMMTAVQQAIKDADILLAIVDVTDRPEEALDMLQPGEDWRGPPMAILLNKVDMLDDEDESALIAWYESNAKSATVFPISADTGDGVDAVQAWVVENIPEGPSMFPKDILAEANERFFVSEIIRKQVFEQYRQELPYQVGIGVLDGEHSDPFTPRSSPPNWRGASAHPLIPRRSFARSLVRSLVRSRFPPPCLLLLLVPGHRPRDGLQGAASAAEDVHRGPGGRREGAARQAAGRRQGLGHQGPLAGVENRH